MREPYAPEGYNRVTPYLTVNDTHRLIDFLVRVFDAQVLDRTERPDGKVAHAAVRIGDSSVEVAKATERFGAMPGALHIYVANVDQTHRRALENEAQVLHNPMEMDYGERASTVMDTAGNHLAMVVKQHQVSQDVVVAITVPAFSSSGPISPVRSS